jgi:hypothetical protein
MKSPNLHEEKIRAKLAELYRQLDGPPRQHWWAELVGNLLTRWQRQDTLGIVARSISIEQLRDRIADVPGSEHVMEAIRQAQDDGLT